MRNYYTNKDNSDKKSVLSVFVIILLLIIFNFAFMLGSAFLIANTAMSEKIISLIAILANAILAITLTAVLILKTKIKPILSALIAFIVIILLKLIINLALSVPVVLSGKGIVMLALAFFFCIAGALIFANIKK